jgi:hypothetical protein
MKSLTLFLFTIILPLSIFSQLDEKIDSTDYKSHLVQDYRIEKLNTTYEENYELIGFRIQIYSGSKKQPAKQARLKFSQQHKDVKAYENYEQPYFKVRVGDFKTKLEALNFQKELSSSFPDCYIVNDVIEFKE